ncbi:aspartyl/asparaginyl beta-hydroxylase domain-containing protein [Micromonospora sp. NPDC047074]|uniref:aspartyl/asparaginyl beta-hydroxylase domain-containing protein n=1 Tax=Micromonospora sp. NPDC047074 TaxID=3154339 RepID=UPI0033F913A9
MTDRLPEAVRLALEWDPERLAAEVRALSDQTWRNQRPYGSAGPMPEVTLDWKILSLRSPGGDPGRTDPGGAGMVGFADTPLLDRCPELRAVLDAIPAPLRSARLMALGPGTRVHTHRDGKCGLPWGRLRLHVPIITHERALTVLDDREWHWPAGELWYGDFNRLHHVRNEGSTTRIHLVIDSLVTPAVIDLFPADFRRTLPYADVVFARQPVPLQEWELPPLCRQFTLPVAFADWAEEDEHLGEPDLPAEITVDGDRLVLAIAGGQRLALVHLGNAEFRLEGWCDERCLRLDPDGTTVLRIRTGRTEREWKR